MATPKSISVSISDAATTTILFYDPKLPFEARWMDLVLRLTVEEKVEQMLHEALAIREMARIAVFIRNKVQVANI